MTFLHLDQGHCGRCAMGFTGRDEDRLAFRRACLGQKRWIEADAGGCNGMEYFDAVTFKRIGGQTMGYADLIAQEVLALSEQRQAEILDFIAFLKTRESVSVDQARQPNCL